MISLYNILKESLLGDFDEIEASTDPKEEIKKEIEQFIKNNYKVKKLKISKEPNENGKYEASCEAAVANRNITSLTNNLFEWGEVKGDFDCSYCDSLTSLEGAPKEVGRVFNCGDCKSLTTLKGAPEEVGEIICSFCISLTSLEGAPKEVRGDFRCAYCNSLTSLEGAPEKVGGDFKCSYCKSLASLKGCPKKVGELFDCHRCISLTSLKGCPKKVGGHFNCIGCKQDFTEDDVRKICAVAGIIYTK